MERGRRNRRGRGHHNFNRDMSHTCILPPTPANNGSILSSLGSFLIMSSLIGLIYLMLQYHCNNNCRDKCDMNNITKNIEDISKNLSIIKSGYFDLEFKIAQFSQDLPKLEGQIDILEALAKTMEKGRISDWDPKRQSQPIVDVFITQPVELQTENFTKSFFTPKPEVEIHQD